MLALLWGVRLIGQPDLPEGVSERRAALIEALGPVRPFDGRLVGFEYAPVKPLPEGWRTEEIVAAIRAIDDQVELRSSPQALADVGTVELLHGRFEEAVASLRSAVGSKPVLAPIASDLAAAYLAVPETRQLFNSLRWSEKALEADPQLPAALFNRAISLEKLSVFQAAIGAWEAYLKVDSTSEWAREATERLRNLREPSYAELWERGRAELLKAALEGNEKVVRELVAEFPQGAREYAEEELLGLWAETESGKGEGRPLLEALGRVGRVLADQTGDFMLLDTVETIDQAYRSGEALDDLIQGHRLYWQAMVAQKAIEPGKACSLVRRAEPRLARAESAMAEWALFEVAHCEYKNDDYSLMLTTLDRLEATLVRVEVRRPVLHGRIYWLRGLTAGLQGYFGAILSDYELALQKFRYSRQVDYEASLHRLIAEASDYLGDRKRAWSHLQEALHLAPRILHPKSKLGIFETASEITRRLGEPHIALYFQDEGLAAAELDADGRLAAGSLVLRAEIREAVGDYKGALADIREARRRAASFDSPGPRANLYTDADRVEGKVLLSLDAQQGLDRLAAVLKTYRQDNYSHYLPTIHLDRAIALQSLGRDDEAEAELWGGIQELERQREGILDEPRRISSFDRSRRIFDQLLALQVRQRRDLAEIFAVAESAQARTLEERLDTGSGENSSLEPASLVEIQNALPPGVVLLEYAVLPDRLLIWGLSRNGKAFKQVQVRRETLRGAVASLRRGLRANAGQAWMGSARQLYNWLIEPVEEQLAGQERIVFVPQGPLHGLPFAALVSPRTARYLVESHACILAPSAAIYLKALENERLRRNQGPIRSLVVSNPLIDRLREPDLPELPRSDEEGELVAKAFPKTEHATAEGATKARLFEGSEYDLLHVGAHAVSNAEFPLLSRLVLTPEAGDPEGGVVFAHELYQQRFTRTRLAVLAACATASGRISESEGVESLVRSFLAAGVPSVVGTLRPVRDHESLEFFREFYRRLSAQPWDPGRALQQSQIALARRAESVNPLATWASFECFGSCGEVGRVR